MRNRHRLGWREPRGTGLPRTGRRDWPRQPPRRLANSRRRGRRGRGDRRRRRKGLAREAEGGAGRRGRRWPPGSSPPKPPRPRRRPGAECPLCCSLAADLRGTNTSFIRVHDSSLWAGLGLRNSNHGPNKQALYGPYIHVHIYDVSSSRTGAKGFATRTQNLSRWKPRRLKLDRSSSTQP